MDTHNLSLEERKALQPGAVVRWRVPSGMNTLTGTVESVGPTGIVRLCDESRVWVDDECHLIQATPNHVAVKGGSLAVEADRAQAARPAKPPAPPPAATPRRVPGQPVPPLLRETWKAAVANVRVRMDAGVPKILAIAEVAPTAGVKLTHHTFNWWQRELVKSHELPPHRRVVVMPSKDAAKLAELQRQYDLLKADRDQTLAERDTARKAVESLRDAGLDVNADLVKALAEMRAAKQEAEAFRAELAAVREKAEAAQTEADPCRADREAEMARAKREQVASPTLAKPETHDSIYHLAAVLMLTRYGKSAVTLASVVLAEGGAK